MADQPLAANIKPKPTLSWSNAIPEPVLRQRPEGRHASATLHGRLVAFALAVSIPLIALAAGAFWRLDHTNRAAAEDRLVSQAHGMALLLDRNFIESERVLHTLAGSRALAHGDLDSFLAEMRVASAAAGAVAIRFGDANGEVKLSTLWPSPIQGIPVRPVGWDVLKSGEATVSNLYISPTTHQREVAVVVPLDLEIGGKHTRSILSMILPRERLLNELLEHDLPPGADASVLDRDHVLVARTMQDDQTVGTSTRSDVATDLAADTGILRLENPEGVEVVVASAHAPFSGYWTQVSIPADRFLDPLRTALMHAAFIAAALLTCSLSIALMLARRIAASLRFLTPGGAAQLLTHRAGSGLREIDELIDGRDQLTMERDRAEQALRELYHRSPLGIAYSDLDGRLHSANAAFLHLVGVTLEEIESSPVRISNLTPEVWRFVDVEAMNEAVAIGACAPYEKEYVRRDGTLIPVVVTISVPDHRQNRCTLFAMHAPLTLRADQDIQWRIAELEAEVAGSRRALTEMANQQAEEVQRREQTQAALLHSQKLEALGQLTGSVAHDFNNMLAAIHGGFTLLQRRVHDETGKRLLQSGMKASERAAKLISQLLTFARREEVQPIVLNLSSILDQARDLIRQAIGPSITLAIEPVPADSWCVVADLHQLEVALLNLTVNARDAMQGSGTLTVSGRHLGADDADREANFPAGDCVLISVRDTGAGMSEDVLARAKEPFFTTKPRGKGTGLGLAMVHGMVERLGGLLHIVSAPGAGTTMTIVLPRSVCAVQDYQAAAAAIDPELHGDATILVVDDDEQVRMVTARFLRDLNYNAIEAANAEAGLALAYESDGVDLVVTDVAMPDTNGQVLARRLRAAYPSMPVLFITGNVGQVTLEGETVLAKPMDFPVFAAAVAQALGRTTSSVASAR